MANQTKSAPAPKPSGSAPKPSGSVPKRSGIHAPVGLSRAIRSVSEAALGKVGQSFATLLSHWPQIVGAEMANKCLPISMNFPRGKNTDAVLHLATHSAFALELSHQTSVILDRVNAFLGFHAIAELRFDHNLLALPESKIVTAAFRGGGGQASVAKASIARNNEPIPVEVCRIYTEIKDPELRASLQSLCRAVANAA